MSYFRDMLAGAGIRKKSTKCVGCKRGVYAFERCCIFCRQENAKFSPRVFEDVAKCTLEEALIECKGKGLSHKVDSIFQNAPNRRRPKKLAQEKYCCVCGGEIPPLAT